jgi:hypothetical protein
LVGFEGGDGGVEGLEGSGEVERGFLGNGEFAAEGFDGDGDFG